ncbi:MAG: VOC family protein [Planctomycetales bacterium]|nr:VOC family protein [Planctomycetales bacterium]
MPNSPLPITHLHHIARVTSDPERSAAFYCQVLGFRPIKRPNFNFRGAWLLGYGVQIHIIERRSPAAPTSDEIDTRANHLAFAVDDHGPVLARLDALGIRYHQQVNAGGIPQIFFRDPDGHHIEIGIYPPHPPFIDDGPPA